VNLVSVALRGQDLWLEAADPPYACTSMTRPSRRRRQLAALVPRVRERQAVSSLVANNAIPRVSRRQRLL